MKNNALNQVKEKNFICLLENNVGGGRHHLKLSLREAMGEAFPTSNFLWNLVNGIYFVSNL